MLREVKSTQRKPRMLAFRVNGTGTAAILSGNTDATLVDNGTGSYKLTFAVPFARVPVVQITPVADAGDLIATIHTDSSAALVEVRLFDGTDGTTAKDGIFHVLVFGYDSADQT